MTAAMTPAFAAYGASLIVLSLNLLGLWVYSGTVRGKTKTTPNTEDAGTVAKGSSVVETDPPAVARVLRAHANAMANIVPFVLVGLVYVLTGASGTIPIILFGVFTVARIFHSVAYVASKQPWRTLNFVIGMAATIAILAYDVRLIGVAFCA